jgi:hypothetical protein
MIALNKVLPCATFGQSSFSCGGHALVSALETPPHRDSTLVNNRATISPPPPELVTITPSYWSAPSALVFGESTKRLNPAYRRCSSSTDVTYRDKCVDGPRVEASFNESPEDVDRRKFEASSPREDSNFPTSSVIFVLQIKRSWKTMTRN